jgi:hypothetical protein
MSSTTDLHNPVVHVGEAPPDFSSEYWVSTTVYFHGFADLPHERGSPVRSSNFSCLGHEWYLKLYPRGDEDSRDGEEWVSLILYHRGAKSINIEFSLNARGRNKGTSTFDSFSATNPINGYGYSKFLELDMALTSLVKGALVIEVRMKEVSDGSTFVPSNPSTCLMLKHLYTEKESADVKFEICGGAVETRDGHPTKKLRSSEIFYAHRCILLKAAPQLADLCKASPDDKSPLLVPLHNVPARAFDALLRYIYGYNILNVKKDMTHIKEILETADRFDVVNLKLKAEDLLISSISLDIDNAIDHYLYAESKNCAALKEKVVLFIVKNWNDVHAAIKEQDISDILLRLSFVHDMVIATKIKHAGDGALDTLPIAMLRRKAHDKGLKIDGSRETLISLLK